jgi:cell wall-associated NlpC family hydrolase
MFLLSCRHGTNEVYNITPADTPEHAATVSAFGQVPGDTIMPARIVAFAKTLLGTPYKFGCTDPGEGFDCSGFINFVFDHFNIAVPRSSVDFTNEGTEVMLENSRPGDLVLFTGTNSAIRRVGHIGIIVANDTSGISFIHSTSGKEAAVTITPLNDYYMGRFVKVIRIVQ